MRIGFIISVLIFAFNTSFSEERGLPIIKNFKSENYEGGSRIYSIVSSTDGLLYAGDKSGILEFNGEKWNKIDCGFSVTSLAIDTNNVVYIAGNKGIGRLSTDSTNTIGFESLNHFISSQKSVRKFRNSRVFNIKGRIIFVLGSEIIINSPESLRIIESPHNFVYYQELNNELYFYSPLDGIFRLEENKLKHIKSDEIIKNKDVRGFFYYKNKLQVLINNQGILNLDDNKINLANDLKEKICFNKIQGLTQLNDSTYAIKTYYSGFLTMNKNGKIIQKYHFDEGLVNNTVFCVYKDIWSNLWIGTASGISTIRLNFPFSKYNTPNGIGTGYAALKYKGKVYLATSHGLYFTQHDENDFLKFNQLFNGHVWGLSEFDGVLYFGHASGIYAWDEKEIEQVSNFPGAWYIKEIPANKNLLLTSTPMGFLLLKRGGINQKLQHAGLLPGLNNSVKNFEFGTENTIWAEFDKGIYKLQLNNAFSEIESVQSFDRIETDNQLKKVRKLNDKLVFIADSGLYNIDTEANFYKDTTFNSANNNNLFPTNIIIDKYQRLWMFTNGKLAYYKFSDGKLRRFRKNEFQFANNSYPIDYENIYCTEENYLIIGQEEGFLGYDLSSPTLGTYSANRIHKVYVTSTNGQLQNVQINSRNRQGAKQSYLPEKIKSKKSIKFHFSAGYSKHNAVKYATYLIGFDEHWTPWSDETIREYTNLPKGKYIFVVRSINKSDEESTPASCEFEILPPWYLSLGAKIAAVLLFILLILFVERLFYFRNQSVRKQQKKKEKELQFRKSQNQIQENLKKEKELIKLRNEKLRIDNLFKSKELANSTMGIIKKNQFLTDLKIELEKIKGFSEQNKVITQDIKKIIRKIDRDIDNEESWKVFEDYFDRVHEKFLNRMKAEYPILTAKDLRLSAYLRMNLSTKEIAPLMNITVRGVEISRYRLRKKIGLDRNDNLYNFLLKF